jgi:ribonuclease HII
MNDAPEYETIIIDGNTNFLPGNTKVQTLIKADQMVAQVSAASIVAKVARDNLMIKMAIEYPDFGFDSHVGYGTSLHAACLAKFGVTPHHRKSFRPMKDLAGGTA